MSDTKYFMCSVSVLAQRNAFEQMQEVAHEIIKQGTYRKSLTMELGDEVSRFVDAAHFFGINYAKPETVLKDIKHKAFMVEESKVLTSLNRDIVWDFFQNEKSEHEIACFLGYAALKSIIGHKTYAKVTNEYLLARFFGCGSTAELIPPIRESSLYRQYSSRYALNKIKMTLSEQWGLSLYGHFTRGFYASFKLSFDELAYQVERSRKSIIKKEKAFVRRDIIAQVKAQVQSEFPHLIL
ncbi:hypothetical protein DYBT9623_00702 [Dyadobacter sp. CECT 9623]|uniref:Uncharacterized protein n=1 Tax=Dyadobacter linearis TaxID=2823330 RepID=A0ABN7R3P4_9BACT|nr:hypothetical protein [Dyadobacter sp. CECT 9623]CAG5067974.1 hypothetical protein DYBT9623_00702 [Dyadobacter sp. CECT 9623]